MTTVDQDEYNKKRFIKHKCEQDLLFFTRYFFKQNKGRKFVVNSHHIEIARAMQMALEGKIPRLIINIPPRYGKTELAVINAVAWCLAKNPSAEFMHLSYGDDLVTKNSSAAKELFLSEAYQELWPMELKADTQGKKRWFNKSGGGMYAAPAGGVLTGMGAGKIEFEPHCGAIIIDDPIKPADSWSIPERRKVNDRYMSTISNRINSEEVPIILIMQRLHEDDLSGFLLNGGSGEAWHHLKIPAIDQSGQALWPFKQTIEVLRGKEAANAYEFSGQYMQSPSPIGGGEFKKEHLQYYDNYDPEFTCAGMNLYILYDPANQKKASSDYTAMVVWGLATDNNYYVLDIVRDKLNPTERINKLIDLHKKWNKKSGKPPKVGVEQYGMMTDEYYLKKAQTKLNYRFPVISLGGKLKKEDRIRRLIPFWESGRIYLPRKILYTNVQGEMNELVQQLVGEELCVFPVGRHDDMIDAMARVVDSELNANFPAIETIYLERGQSERDAMMGSYDDNDFMSW